VKRLYFCSYRLLPCNLCLAWFVGMSRKWFIRAPESVFRMFAASRQSVIKPNMLLLITNHHHPNSSCCIIIYTITHRATSKILVYLHAYAGRPLGSPGPPKQYPLISISMENEFPVQQPARITYSSHTNSPVPTTTLKLNSSRDQLTSALVLNCF
jgi:hypothetical protein